MEILDRIYGREKINEKVLEELIYSPSVQRLKGVSQLGMPNEYYHRKGGSRYEHSLGVMVLLRRLGAGLEEQVAGLLHDISHTAFSHVIDWVVGDPTKENYQDETLLKIIKNSEIPEILANFDLDYRRISNHENFPLLEKKAPSLCADRIDYSLREIFLKGGSKLSEKILKDLIVKENQIVFKNKEIAEIFAKEYVDLQKNHWAGDEARTRYYLLSQTLKKGLEKGLISFEDFNKTDDYILDILENSKDDFILDNLNILKKGFDVVESENGIELKKKFRYIDPEVLVNGSYKNLSFLSKEYFELLEIEKEKSKLVKKVRIVQK